MLKLDCYQIHEDAHLPQIVPGRPERDWMDSAHERHPYRCLPLTIANTSGWEILCPCDIVVEWNGGDSKEDVVIVEPLGPCIATSHFANGVLTFHTGYLFRTNPGWEILAMGAPNYIKDGIQALVGIVETDWIPFTFTMNWKFTRPCRVTFKKDEPFCFITMMKTNRLEEVRPTTRLLRENPTLESQYSTWSKDRSDFNLRLAMRDPEAAKQKWQRHYFKGQIVGGATVKNHTNKRRLKGLK